MMRIASAFATGLLLLLNEFGWGAEPGPKIEVDHCDANAKLPVKFNIDCSMLVEEGIGSLCRAFIERQACQVYPSYKKILGYDIAPRCEAINYIIVPDASMAQHTPGGSASNCNVRVFELFSIKDRAGYDIHEILHHFQASFRSLPGSDGHFIFGPSMVAALEQIADARSYYLQRLQRLKEEYDNQQKDLAYLDKHKGECAFALNRLVTKYYLDDHDFIVHLYSELRDSRDAYPSNPENWVGAAIIRVAKNNVEIRPFLAAHNCAALPDPLPAKLMKRSEGSPRQKTLNVGIKSGRDQLN